MSCPVCNGLPGCPCCSPEPNMTTCPACGGAGEIYYNEDGDQITKEQYNALPKGRRDTDRCAECDGTGEIEYEYQPDWDSMPGGHDYY